MMNQGSLDRGARREGRSMQRDCLEAAGLAARGSCPRQRAPAAALPVGGVMPCPCPLQKHLGTCAGGHGGYTGKG